MALFGQGDVRLESAFGGRVRKSASGPSGPLLTQNRHQVSGLFVLVSATIPLS
jgi:hypothetical protein